MTTDDARKKLCPFRKRHVYTYFERQGPPEIYFIDEEFLACLAGDCMAWRWITEMVLDCACDVRPNDDGINEIVPRPVISNTEGFCGLVGKCDV